MTRIETARKLCVVSALAIGAPVALAQWTVTNLHPTGATSSRAFGVEGGQQVGYVTLPGTAAFRGSLWTGTAASWVDLTPGSPMWQSGAYGVHAGTQAGFMTVDGSNHACRWSGTAGTWVDLNPGGAVASWVMDARAGQQVGHSTFGTVIHASLWTGSSASWIDLQPAGLSRSEGLGGDGVQQVGVALVGGAYHASLWSGSAASWVDLHPAGSYESRAYDVDGGQQVGEWWSGSTPRACLWTGTAASWVNLHPTSGGFSQAIGVHAGEQVGATVVSGVFGASLWSGSAASWVNLHAYLPAEFTSSAARAIWHGGGVTYVVGYGMNSATERVEALMWTAGEPECPTSASGMATSEPAPGAAALTWVDEATTETGYHVLRERREGASWVAPTVVATLPADSTAFTDSPGRGVWRYSVAPFNSACEAAYTMPVGVKPASPTSPSVADVGGSARVAWTDASAFETTFLVQRQQRVGTSWTATTTIATLPRNSTSVMDSPGAGRWRYRIRAQNPVGNSVYTAWVAITLP